MPHKRESHKPASASHSAQPSPRHRLGAQRTHVTRIASSPSSHENSLADHRHDTQRHDARASCETFLSLSAFSCTKAPLRASVTWNCTSLYDFLSAACPYVLPYLNARKTCSDVQPLPRARSPTFERRRTATTVRAVTRASLVRAHAVRAGVRHWSHSVRLRQCAITVWLHRV